MCPVLTIICMQVSKIKKKSEIEAGLILSILG